MTVTTAQLPDISYYYRKVESVLNSITQSSSEGPAAWLVHGGRCLVAFTDNEREVAGWPEVAYEAVRAINHVTGCGRAVPAPLLYDVLGNLKGVGWLLPQALNQLAAGLTSSLEVFDFYDRDGQNPACSVQEATTHLEDAATAAHQLGQALEAAQSAIAHLGYHQGSS